MSTLHTSQPMNPQRTRRRPQRPYLTSRQEKFAQLIALKGLSQAEAYRQAYNAHNQSPETIYPDASVLANHNPKVIARIAELKASLTSEAVTTAADLVKELKQVGFATVAARDIRPADKVAAIDKIAKILGLYRDVEDERPRAVITNITVILDHGDSRPVAISVQPARVVEGEKGASAAAEDGS